MRAEAGHTLLWAELSREQLQAIRALTPFNFEGVAKLLIEYLGMTDIFAPSSPGERVGPSNREYAQAEALLKFYVMNLRFAVESGMSDEKASTLFSVLKLAHFTSMERSLPATQSQEEMQSLLLIHAVEHPPYSIGVFSPEDLRRILDFATDTYYRHYRLYRCLFTARPLMDLSIAPQHVENAPAPKPLSEATAQGAYEGEDVPVEPEPPEEVPLTKEEAAAAQAAEDSKVLEEDPKSEMIQQIVEKRLEKIQEDLNSELSAKQEEYRERIAAAGEH